jgi:hypothetical protein
MVHLAVRCTAFHGCCCYLAYAQFCWLCAVLHRHRVCCCQALPCWCLFVRLLWAVTWMHNVINFVFCMLVQSCYRGIHCLPARLCRSGNPAASILLLCTCTNCMLLLLLPSALTAFPVAGEYSVTLFHSEELVWLNDTRAAQLWAHVWAATSCLRGRGKEGVYASFREPRRCLSVQISILRSLIENID